MSVVINFYEDDGDTVLPSAVGVEYYTGSEWKSVSNLKYSNITKDLILDFDSVSATKIRVVLTPTANKAVGITEIMVMGSDPSASAIPDGVVVEEKKFITQNDIVASVITLKNNSNQRKSEVRLNLRFWSNLHVLI